MGRRKIILSLGGSFNPIHQNNIDIMVKTKEWLGLNTDFEVVSWILVVTIDKFLISKFWNSNEKILTGEHRMELCQLASARHDWLMVYPVHCVSSYMAGMIHRNNDNTLHLGIVMRGDKYDQMGRAHWRHNAMHGVHVDIIIGRDDVTTRMDTGIHIVPDIVGDLSFTGVRKVLDRIGSAESEEAYEKLSIMMSMADYAVKHREDLYITQEDIEGRY